MNEKKPEPISDIVERAAAELRSLPVPPGPPPELLDSLLRMAQDNTRHPKSSDHQPLSRIQKIRNTIMTRPFRSLSAFAACCLILIAAYLAVGPMTHGSVAFADVAALIQNAKTMVCTGQLTMTPPMPGTDGKPQEIKILSLEDGRMRQEMGKQIMIFNMPSGKSLTLIPEAKMAFLTTTKGMPKSSIQQDWLAALKKMTEDPQAEDLGTKTMNGKEVKGFRVKNEVYSSCTLWVEPKSGNPILVEFQQQLPDLLSKELPKLADEEIPKLEELLKENPKTAKALKEKSPENTKEEIKKEQQRLNSENLKKEIQKRTSEFLKKQRTGETTIKMELSNFQFDVPLEESLFSLTPPEGYALQEMNMDFSGGGLKDVIEVLRRAAEADNGAFPDSLTGMALTMKLLMKPTMKMSFEMGMQAAKDKAEGKEPKMPEVPPEILKQQSEIASLVGRMNMFLQKNVGWKYAGKGVKMGDALTPIFWYVPKDSKQGQVVYGDLSVRDVPVDQLPPDPEKVKNNQK